MTISVSTLIMVAVLVLTLFLAFLNLSFWNVHRQDHAPLWLTLWLVTNAVFILSRMTQFAALSDPLYVVAARVLLTSAYILAWVGYEFVNNSISYQPRRLERLVFIAIVTAPILLLWTSNLILTHQVVNRTVLFGGTYHGVSTGALYLPANLWILFVAVFLIVRLVRIKNSLRGENLPLALGFGFVILFSLNDFISVAFNLVWIRLSDYSYLPLPILFSYIQVRRLGRLYKDMNVIVQERTAALSQANETLRAEMAEREQAQKALQEGENRYRMLFEANPHPMWVYDIETLAFLVVNDAAVAHYGYSQEEFFQMTIKDIRPEEEIPALMDNLGRERLAFESSGPWKHRKKDGTIIQVEIRSHGLVLNGRPARLVTVNDITERLQAENTMIRKADEMTALYETTHDLVIEQDLTQLLHTIVERAARLVGATGGGLYLSEPGSRQIRCVVSYNIKRDYTGVILKYGEGAAGVVAETGKPMIVDNYPTWEGRAALFEEDRPFISVLSVPMQWQDHIFGVLHVLDNQRPHAFDQEHLKIVTLFASQAAIAVENARLFESEQRRRREAAALAEVSRDISGSLQLDYVLERIATHAKELLNAGTSAVYLSEPPQPVLRASAAIGPDAEEIKHDPLSIGEGILGGIAARKVGEIVNKPIEDQRAIIVKGTDWLPYEHLMGAPVVSKDQLVGLIAVWRVGAGNEFNSSDLDFLTNLAGQVAVAIENARLFENTRQRMLEIEAVHTVSTALRSAQTLNEALPIILDQLMSLLNAGGASLEIVDAQNGEIITELAHGVWVPVTGLRTPLGTGISGQVIATGKPYISTDVVAEGKSVHPELFKGLNHVACVPVIAQHQPIGTLWIGRQTPILIEEVSLLSAIGEMVGNAIQRMRLHEQMEHLLDDVQVANRELSQAYDTTLEGWAKALELRDKETEGHSRRVSDLTVRLAHCIGVTEPELTHIRRGVLLHDIGKMGIPDQLLKKTGPLTKDEWIEMRKHPQYAYDLLYPITYLRSALDIPYCHHERWDGSGYPRGLKGAEIPLAARIFTVVDVYDALSYDRPYRSAWPKQRVLHYLHEYSGKHFDPQIVVTFFNLLNEK